MSPVDYAGRSTRKYFYISSALLQEAPEEDAEDKEAEVKELKRKLSKTEEMLEEIKEKMPKQQQQRSADPKDDAEKMPKQKSHAPMSAADGIGAWQDHPDEVARLPYKCTQCDRRFKTSNSVRSHRYRKHAGPNGTEMMKTCVKCELSYPRANFYRHFHGCKGRLPESSE